MEVLESRGAPEKILISLRTCIRANRALQSDIGKAKSWFEVATGLEQGVLNVLLLFNFYIDIIDQAFQTLISHLGVISSHKMDGKFSECCKPDV